MTVDREKKRKSFLARRPNEEPARRVMTPRMKEEMLAVLIRNESAFLAVKAKLTPEKLESWGGAYAAVWRIVLDFYSSHFELPPYNVINAELQALIDNNTGEIQSGEIASVDAFLQYAFDGESFGDEDVADSHLYRSRAVEMAVRFMQESTARRLADKVSLDRGTISKDLPSLLLRFQSEAADAAAIQSPKVDEVFPTGWDTKQRFKLFTTGFATLNLFLTGQRAGEVIGVLGISGTFKTTLAVQAVVNMAGYCAAKWAEGGIQGGKKPVVFYVTYETDRQEFGERCISCHAGIARDTLIAMDSLEDLPGPDDPVPPCEVNSHASQIDLGTYISQRERAEAAVRLINEHVVFVDFSHMDPDASIDDVCGTGGIPEVAAFVQQKIREKDIWPMVLWLDHISGMVDMIEDGSHEDDRAKLHRLISKAPGQARRMIAKKFECPVWLVHQFNGAANAKLPGASVHHTEAEGGKLFHKYADFMICIGKPNDSQLVSFEATKTRRKGPTGTKVVRIDGEFNRLHDVSEIYVVDSIRRRIITKTEADNAPSKHSKQAQISKQINKQISDKEMEELT